MDWRVIFLLDRPILETILRGLLTYLGIIILLRLVLKRQAGSLGLSDMLLIVVIADASQNAMAGEYRSWPSGMVLVATLLVCNYALDWAAFHWAWFRHLVEPEPTLLIRNGRPLFANLRREQVDRDELEAALRLKGVASIREVREARLEPGGNLSVLTREAPCPPAPRADTGATAMVSGNDAAGSLDRLVAAVAALERVVTRLEREAAVSTRARVSGPQPGCDG